MTKVNPEFALPLAPETPTDRDEPLAFRVWANDPSYMEDPNPWRVEAMFRFLTEALDYIAYCQDRESTVVFQSPCGCQRYTKDDPRAVWKPGCKEWTPALALAQPQARVEYA